MEQVDSDNITHISAPLKDTEMFFNGIKFSAEFLELLKEKLVWKDGRFVIEDLTSKEEQIIKNFIGKN